MPSRPICRCLLNLKSSLALPKILLIFQYLFLHRALIDIALEKGRLNRVDKAGGVDAFIKEYEELIKRKREERKELERKHKRRRGRD